MTKDVDSILRGAAAELHGTEGIVTNVVMVYETMGRDGVTTELRTASTPLPWWSANGMLEGGKVYE